MNACSTTCYRTSACRGLLAAVALAIAGCGSIPGIGGPGGSGAPQPAAGEAESAQIGPPPEPNWRTTGEALSLREPAGQPVPLGQSEPLFQPYSQDPFVLYSEVAARCGGARVNQEEDFLTPLVTDLYLSGVEPGHATEALILADCAPLASIVRELVAQGGEAVVPAVVQRALFLSGPNAEPIIESAASAGLERNLGGFAGRPGAGGGSLSYAMAYFPTRAATASVETAGAVNTLYSNATPGYGIYTFVLLGKEAEPDPTSSSGDGEEAGVGRYQELLRVIETYVLASDEGGRAPSPLTHAFLIAVHPERDGSDLAGQTGPELSAPIRRDLARHLRRGGDESLAGRLETGQGPFLVSSLEPRLLPSSAVSPRLVTDLSDIGGEYMYAIVDAYDRPVSNELAGRPESLEPIRERLLGLFSRRVPAQDLDASIRDAWVFRVGGGAAVAAGSAAGESGRDGPDAGQEPGAGGGAKPGGGTQREPDIGYQSPQVRGT